MKYLIALCLLAWPLAASAQTSSAPPPRSIQDCEGIKVDMAYNQCLAAFGPAAHTRPGKVEAGQDPEVATPANPRRYGRLAKRKGRGLSRGRKRASFAVKSSRRSGKRSGHRRRR
jgi:hypothetical protein